MLLALAIILLPKFFDKENPLRDIRVEAPPIPQPPQTAQQLSELKPQPPVAQEPPQSQPTAEAAPTPEPSKEKPVSSTKAPPNTTPEPAKSQVATQASDSRRLDGAGLPQSWSIQLASLSNRDNADRLLKRLRGAGYKAYVRSSGSSNRVLVGPMIEKAEAQRLLKKLNAQYKVEGQLVQFKP